jgi:hypothetical protein
MDAIAMAATGQAAAEFSVLPATTWEGKIVALHLI